MTLKIAVSTLGFMTFAITQSLSGSVGQSELTSTDIKPFNPEVIRIVDSLRIQFNKIEDYQVRLTVSIKMPGLRMPKKRMTLSFKQPDKAHLKARGFAMIPKTSMMLSPDSLFARLSDSSMINVSTSSECPCVVIEGSTKLTAELQPQMRITVDTLRWVVTGISTALADKEILSLKTQYTEVIPGIFMPLETRMLFTISEEFLRVNPRAAHARDNPEEAVAENLAALEKDAEEKQSRTGESIIRFSLYKVNEGLDGALFEEKKDE